MSQTSSRWSVWGPSVLRAAFIPLLAAAYLGVTEWQRRSQDAASPLFPDVSTEPLAGPGEMLAKGTFAGRPFLAVFWATWCAPCQKQRKMLDPWVQSQGWRSQVLGIATMDQPGSVRKAEAENPHPFPSIIDIDGKLAASLGIQALPASLVVNREGRVSRRFTGPLSANDLQIIAQELR